LRMLRYPVRWGGGGKDANGGGGGGGGFGLRNIWLVFVGT